MFRAFSTSSSISQSSGVLEVPAALLRRLYEIEEISSTRRPLRSVSDSTKRAVGPRKRMSAREVARDRAGGARGESGLKEEEAVNFLKAFEMSECDDEGFPTRLAWELQSEFWPQNTAVEVTGTGVKWRIISSKVGGVLLSWPWSATLFCAA